MGDERKPGWGALPEHLQERRKIISLRQEPAQWEIAIDLDIPAHKQTTPAVEALLNSIVSIIEQTIEMNKPVKADSLRLGVKIVGIRIERC